MASGYFWGVALESTATTITTYLLWDRLTWWVVPVSVACWFRGIVLLVGAKRHFIPLPYQILSVIPLVYSAGLAIIGSFSDFLYHYQKTYPHPALPNLFIVPSNFPTYYLYGGFWVFSLWITAVLLIYSYRRSSLQPSQKYQLRLLILGSSILALGATVNVIGYDNLEGQLSQHAGSLVMTVGLGLIGSGVAYYNALMEQQHIEHDFRRSFWITVVVVSFFLLMFHLVHLISPTPISPVTIPLLVFLVTFTFVTRPWVQHWFNKLVLPDWEARFLLQVAEVHRGITTAPDQKTALAIAQKDLLQITQEAQTAQLHELIQAEIEILFRHKEFKKDDILINSRLFTLVLVQQSLREFAMQQNLSTDFLSEGEKARVLRHFLTKYIHHKLNPYPNGSLPDPPTDRWIEYMILSRSYLEDKTRKETIAEIYQKSGIRLASGNGTGGRVYAQHLENGRRNLATLLWQDEMKTYSRKST